MWWENHWRFLGKGCWTAIMNTPLGQSVSRQMDSCGDQAKDTEDFNILTTSCVRALHLLFQSFSAPDRGLSRSGVSNSSRLMDCSSPGSSVRGDSPGKNTRVGCHFLLHISCISCIGWAILYHLAPPGKPSPDYVDSAYLPQAGTDGAFITRASWLPKSP